MGDGVVQIDGTTWEGGIASLISPTSILIVTCPGRVRTP